MKKQSWQTSKVYAAILSFTAALLITASGFALLYFGSRYEKNGIKAIPALTNGAIPKRLIIPKISVDAAVEAVGETADGRMGIPSNFSNVAWYSPGPKPGEKGSAVIDGHLDNVSNPNAVFMNLARLKSGDEIDILDAKGQKIKFRVIDTETYDDDNAPLGKIFDRAGDIARLNLITCDGLWNQKTKNYSNRLVVYSVMVLD